jgi:hypothetical protein
MRSPGVEEGRDEDRISGAKSRQRQQLRGQEKIESKREGKMDSDLPVCRDLQSDDQGSNDSGKSAPGARWVVYVGRGAGVWRRRERSRRRPTTLVSKRHMRVTAPIPTDKDAGAEESNLGTRQRRMREGREHVRLF